MTVELMLFFLGMAALAARLGFCLYLTGSSQSKNAGAAALRVITDLCVAVLAFWAIGTFILPEDAALGSTRFFTAAIILIATGAALGGTLERMNLWPLLAASALLAGVIVPLSARWIWHGWLHTMGLVDVGGAAPIDLTGGLFAAAGAAIVGPRAGKYNTDGSSNLIPGHSIPLTAAGLLAIAAGSLAQIVGCAAIAQVPPTSAAAAVLLAAAAGGLAGLLFGRFRYATTDFHYVSVGLLAGLISAAASAGRVEALPTLLIGACGGLLASWASAWLDLTAHIDDPGFSISIYAVSGAWSLLAAGAFLGGIHQLAIAALGILAVGSLAFASAMILFLALKYSFGLRPSPADELDGGDLAEHDLNAYPDFQQTTIKSYHLRQM